MYVSSYPIFLCIVYSVCTTRIQIGCQPEATVAKLLPSSPQIPNWKPQPQPQPPYIIRSAKTKRLTHHRPFLPLQPKEICSHDSRFHRYYSPHESQASLRHKPIYILHPVPMPRKSDIGPIPGAGPLPEKDANGSSIDVWQLSFPIHTNTYWLHYILYTG